MKYGKTILCASVAPFALLLSGAAFAQEAGEPKPAVEETQGISDIVVTAQRRSESAQRTALAISVVSDEELQKQGIQDVASLTDAVPGFKVTSASPNANLVLRGIGAGGSAQFTTPSVMFSIFGVPLSRQHSTIAAFYDVERVEVLKGPQGTLYGRNANVGALNLVPKRPTFELEGNLNLTVGTYDTVNASGGVSIPITDTLATRVAFSTNHHKGYLSNGYNDANNQSARASVLFQPSSDFSALFFVDYFNNDSRGPSTIYRYVTPGQEFQVPDNPWFAFAPAGCGTPALCPSWADSAGPAINAAFRSGSVVDDDGYLKVRQAIYGAQFDANLGFANLTVIPALVTTAIDFLNYSTGFNFYVKDQTVQKSVEMRLASPDDSKVRWVVGGIYYVEDQDSNNSNFEPAGYQIIRTPNLQTKSFGLFGEMTVPVLDWLRGVGGLRYTNERQSMDGFILVGGAPTAANCPSPAIGVAGPVTAYGFNYPVGYCQIPNAGSVKFDDVSFKAGFEMDLGARSLFYGNVRSGFKSGGLNPGLPPNTYDPEKLVAYEVGSKNRFFDNTLQFNLELYYWDYKKQQIGLRGPLNPTGQAPKPVLVSGDLYGAEASIVWSPTPADRFTADVLYAKGKFDIFPQVVNSSGTIGGLTDFNRYSLPELSGTVSYSHDFTLPSGGRITPSVSSHFETKILMAPLPVADQRPGDFRDAYAKFDLALTYTNESGKLRITAFVDNLTNKAIVGVGTTNNVSRGIFYRPATNAVDARYAAIEPPRTFGIRSSLDF